MAFKTSRTATLSTESPEALLRDLKTKRVKGPLADQADLWRAYQQSALDAPDVALQLPTGGGKTLVGLMLAEWRRRKFRERVAYLCPTKQLVNQVAEQAQNHYGLDVHAFTGPRKDYDKEACAEYQNCERIAITTYSSLFNSVPFFNDPNIILLDDVHAADQYISNLWTLQVQSWIAAHKPLYDALLAVLKPAISVADFERLARPEQSFRDRQWVEKVPSPTVFSIVPELVATIDAITGNAAYTAAEHKYAWRGMRDHLSACHVYLAAGAILIRPLVPPTSTHTPFEGARQRIYMSATLGAGGDLERITGRRAILRLVSNPNWDRQAIGRRYFLFPEKSLDADQQGELCARLMKEAGRTLVLTPDGPRANEFSEFVKATIGFPVFDAAAIEDSKGAFVAAENAVAIVANRYDGIDFPEDQCRLSIVEGLPRATNPQERFLINRMAAIDLLNSRITTRLVQAFGRCTRSDQDYSAVVINGEELNKHLMTPDRRKFLHPELQAELEFGIEHAKSATVDEFAENFEIFLQQGDDWREANGDIVERRQHLAQEAPPGADELARSVKHEVIYQEALWNGNAETAHDAAREVLATLNHPSLRGYRALWHYLAGSAAWLAFQQGRAGFDAHAREQFRSALKAARTIAWMVPLSNLAYTPEEAPEVLTDKDSWAIVERLEALLDELGTLTNRSYDKFEAEVRVHLEQNDARTFERGHELLGRLLGYDAGNRNDTASPDPWWIASDNLCFIFEDHSDGDAGGRLEVYKARQACTHPNWVRENLPRAAKAEIVSVLITPAATAEPAAIPHLKDVVVWPLDEFREWAKRAMEAVREIRREYPNAGDLVWRAQAVEKLTAACITPRTLKALLMKRSAAEYFS